LFKPLTKLRKFFLKGDLESAILDVYFNAGGNCQKEFEILKSFAMQLIITGAERNKTGGMNF